MITTSGLNALGLVKTANDAIDNFLQDWQIAATNAIMTFDTPKEDDANRQWWIAFAGNMLWAVTIFVAPEAAIGEAVVKLAVTRALRVQQAASIVGATLAGGLVSKLSSSSPPDLS